MNCGREGVNGRYTALGSPEADAGRCNQKLDRSISADGGWLDGEEGEDGEDRIVLLRGGQIFVDCRVGKANWLSSDC